MKIVIQKSLLFLIVIAMVAFAGQEVSQWAVHDRSRPHPPIVTPGKVDSAPPSDAIVLFDGQNLSEWKSCKDESEAKWKVKDGYMEVVPKTGDIHTRQLFGSCQLHIEWCIPDPDANAKDQSHGNSGLFMMERYEIQILDSYSNVTYADGQAGAVYGQNPPQVNVCKKPGQWQSYDVVFHAPVFKDDKVVKSAIITVFQNGVLVQDHWEIKGATYLKPPVRYVPHADKMPLRLQDHHNSMKFRNIWIRPLND